MRKNQSTTAAPSITAIPQNLSANTAQQREAREFVRSTPSTGGAIDALWSAAKGHMTKEELSWIAGLSIEADTQMCCLEEVLLGVGCLVAADNGRNGRPVTGNFQSTGEVSRLLFVAANAIGSARALHAVAEEARLKVQMADLEGVSE